MGGSFTIGPFLTCARPLEAHEQRWLDDAATWDMHTLDGRGSFIVRGLATFERRLIDEELPTLDSITDWTFGMDLAPSRGDVETTTFAVRRPDSVSAPSLARRYAAHRRRDNGR